MFPSFTVFTGRLSSKHTVLLSVFLLTLLMLYLISLDWVSVLTFAIALAMGATLNGLHFGFSRSFQELILARKTLAMRAIIWMLALAIVLFAVMQNFALSLQGERLQGFIRPVGIYSLLGAFLFGIGMQLGIGCTSGTLNRAGQLQVLSLPTLLMMMVGGTLAVWSQEVWLSWSAMSPWAFQQNVHWLFAIFIQLLLLFILYRGLLRLELSSASRIQSLFKTSSGNSINWHPWLLAGLSLAVLNAALFWVSGSPWSISSIFPYWGIHLIEKFELPIDWVFWGYALENPNHLGADAVNHTVSLTTWGVVFGAWFMTLWKTNATVSFSELFSENRRAWLVSVVAGFIMGFGAVMASGCNIGAFFSGIASGSLHGWIWLPFALMGNALGIWLKAKWSL